MSAGFDLEVHVLRGTAESPVCDRCGAPARVCADTPAGPLLLCLDDFGGHVAALVQRNYPLTLIRGLH